VRTASIHRCRLAWTAKAFIEIENAKGKAADEGLRNSAHMFEAEFNWNEEICPLERSSSAQPAICVKEAMDVLFYPLQLREETKYFVDVCVPLTLDDAIRSAQTSAGWPLSGRLAKAFERDPPRRWKPYADDATIVTGSLNLGSYAGIVELGIQGYPYQVKAEVACRKLNYFSEFKTLLEDIAEQLAELLLHQESPTSIDFRVADVDAVSKTGAIVLLRHLMKADNLPHALALICSRPRTRFTSRTEFQETPDSAHLAVDCLTDAFGDGELTRTKLFPALFRGLAPARYPVEIFEDRVDTPENRYALHVTNEIRELVFRLEAHLSRKKRLIVASECRTWLDKLDDALSHTFWRGVGEMRSVPTGSPVL
jgi:uncharacterized protein